MDDPSLDLREATPVTGSTCPSTGCRANGLWGYEGDRSGARERKLEGWRVLARTGTSGVRRRKVEVGLSGEDMVAGLGLSLVVRRVAGCVYVGSYGNACLVELGQEERRVGR